MVVRGSASGAHRELSGADPGRVRDGLGEGAAVSTPLLVYAMRVAVCPTGALADIGNIFREHAWKSHISAGNVARNPERTRRIIAGTLSKVSEETMQSS